VDVPPALLPLRYGFSKGAPCYSRIQKSELRSQNSEVRSKKGLEYGF